MKRVAVLNVYYDILEVHLLARSRGKTIFFQNSHKQEFSTFGNSICVNVITLFNNCVMFSMTKELIFAKRRLSHYKINEVNTSEIKKSWNEQEEKLKQKFATVTNNDLTFEESKNEKMSGVLQVKWDKTKEGLHKIIETL